MKTLVVTTGQERPIMDVWLPSLRSKGEYTGDVLFVDYDEYNLSDAALKYLQTQKNIIYRKTQKFFSNIGCDALRAFFECIKPIFMNYDVILLVHGNDVEFLKPIQPLLDLAKEDFCYVAIPHLWDLQDYQTYSSDFNGKKMISIAVLAGKTNEIRYALYYIVTHLQRDEYGCEEVALNILIYHEHYPSREVGAEWNSGDRSKACILHNSTLLALINAFAASLHKTTLTEDDLYQFSLLYLPNCARMNPRCASQCH